MENLLSKQKRPSAPYSIIKNREGNLSSKTDVAFYGRKNLLSKTDYGHENPTLLSKIERKSVIKNRYSHQKWRPKIKAVAP